MSLEISGKITKAFDLVTGEGKKGPWQKREYLLEVPGQFPKTILCCVWGKDKIDKFALQEGDDVKASIEIESRERNGRYYTEVKIYKVG